LNRRNGKEAIQTFTTTGYKLIVLLEIDASKFQFILQSKAAVQLAEIGFLKHQKMNNRFTFRRKGVFGLIF